jgi:homoserine O-acetyltransferase/O-succinyltransferase
MKVTKQETVLCVFGPDYREVMVGRIAMLATHVPLALECGAEISDFPLAYQTYGTLNAAKSNAVLVCHGLTGDQYAASTHPVTGKPGWWESIIGPGKAIDTKRFFVIATNVIGGCMGSLGPKSANPATGKPYGPDFPVVTIADMVRAQALLLDYLGIEQLFSVLGGSMGGMVALTWAVLFPHRVFSAVPIATSTRHSAQNIAFHEIGRQSIMVDPDWCEGRYLEQHKCPVKGLSVARMAAHVTYLSEDALHRKFGRMLQDRDQLSFGFEADFQVESYLRHQGAAFVERFDANSYFYITRAMDYFDLAQEGALTQCFTRTKTRFLVISFSSDWLFPTSESRLIVRALNAAAANVSFAEITTDKGHDAFLLDEPEFFTIVRGFLQGAAAARGIE